MREHTSTFPLSLLSHSPNAVAGMAAHHGNPVTACKPSTRAAVADTGAAASARRGAADAASLPTWGLEDVDMQRAAVWVASGSERRRLSVCEGKWGIEVGRAASKKRAATRLYRHKNTPQRRQGGAGGDHGGRHGRATRGASVPPAEQRFCLTPPPLSRFVFSVRSAATR